MGEMDTSPLTEVQREIMEVVWQHGPVSVSQVHEQISKRRPVARNTVQTLMVRLEEKGWLRHEEEGRKFLYSAAKARSRSLGARVAHMIDGLFGGSPAQMVNALLEYRGLSKSELENIRNMIEQAEQGTSKPAQPGKTHATKQRPNRKGPTA